ncbi:NERD domain-containing protein [Acidithiobacillus sp. GGI-221]|nr:NERD domain-containing protein [Acidithiobacillus sp. GGI-221]
MILKERDTSWRKKAMELDLLLSCHLTPEHRRVVEQEKWNLQAGESAEAQVAYDLNFRFREYENWVLLHDLRLVDGNDVAQIDHLLMVRTLDFFVLETKNYARGVRISPQGEFEAYPKEGGPYPIDSPLAQNDRHILLLQRLLKRHNVIPHRMGLAQPIFHNYVMISGRGRIDRPTPDSFPNVIKGDLFYENVMRRFQKAFTFLDAVQRLPQVVRRDTLQSIGQQIASWHQPAPYPDYRKRFGISEDEIQNAGQASSCAGDHQGTGASTLRKQSKPSGDTTKAKFCFECKAPISQEEASFVLRARTDLVGGHTVGHIRNSFRSRGCKPEP